MTWVNLSDVEAQLAGAGLLIDKPLDCTSKLASGAPKPQRWKTTDSKGGERPGWTQLKEWVSKSGNIYIVGAYGIWSGNDDGRTRIELPKRDEPSRPALSEEDLAAARAAQKALEKAAIEQRKAEAKQAAAWAATVWHLCAAPESHEYLTRKQIGANGARVWLGKPDGEDLRLPGLPESEHWRLMKLVGSLAVPMHDINGNVVGVEFIPPKGHEFENKQGWPKDMAKAGSFGVIGGFRRGGVLLLAEGFSTAATLAEATRLPVAYAFSANNLGNAAKAIRAKYKQLRLLICADDDAATEAKTGKNPGRDAAQLAASEIEGAAWMVPDFKDADGNDLRTGRKLSDFNDLALLVNPIAVTNQIAARLDALKWRDAPALGGSRGRSDQGGGETDGNGRRRAQSVMPLDDIVARYVPLDDGTGKYVFDLWTNKIASREQLITLLPAGVRGDDIKRHPVWIERGAYYLDQVGFDPTGEDAAVALNTWKGWPMQPKAGRCDRLIELIDYLCSAEENAREVSQWLLKWMAYPLQHPGAKMSSAVIMHGPQGTGKSTVFQCLAKIYGDYATVLNQRGLEDRFNADWVDSKLFILAEEVVTRAEMWHIKNELKELVTGEWIRVNPKNIAAYRQRNQVNIAYNSNENQPLPLDNDDRRHCVIYTPPALCEGFYDEVFLEIEAGGVAAFYDYLLKLDLTGFHPKKRPPMTESKRALIALSLPSEQRFVYEWVGGDLGLPVCPAISTDVYAAYLKWCKARGEPRPRPDNQFHGAVGRLAGWEKKKARLLAGLNLHAATTEPRNVLIPPAGAIDRDHRLPSVNFPDGTGEAAWLTACAMDFQTALKDETVARRAFG